jgi:hypothetical protein
MWNVDSVGIGNQNNSCRHMYSYVYMFTTLKTRTLVVLRRIIYGWNEIKFFAICVVTDKISFEILLVKITGMLQCKHTENFKLHLPYTSASLHELGSSPFLPHNHDLPISLNSVSS